jgi:hypothetical protein
MIMKKYGVQTGNLPTRVGMVLSGFALAVGIGVGVAGSANAAGCATIVSDMAFHNTHTPDPHNWAAVDAYNREADALDATARSCGYTLTP